jgi:excisionase family DNA binding protein
MGVKLMNVETASKYLGMSPGWLRASSIPVVRMGRRRLYRQEDLDTFIERRVRR